MIGPDALSRVTAQAVVPEQVLPYVQAVADSKPRIAGDCVGYLSEGTFVLVGYPLQDPLDEKAVRRSLEVVMRMPGLRKVIFIGPCDPPGISGVLSGARDAYYALPIPPPPPGQKLRNLLKRATREVSIERGGLPDHEHLAMIQDFLASHPVSPETRHIFSRLTRYLEISPTSLLLSGRLVNGRLAGFVVGEYASLTTAFFMFSFRNPELAPPGTSDLLLSGLLDEALKRGQVQMNMGLGINRGIRFFKEKWGAFPYLPHVQASWEPFSPGPIRRLLGYFRLGAAQKLVSSPGIRQDS